MPEGDTLFRVAFQISKQICGKRIEAARARATLGEISDALESEYGRYQARPKSIAGVYLKENKMEESFQQAREEVEKFALRVGRRPRILIAKLGQDGHDRGARVIATSFADLGFGLTWLLGAIDLVLIPDQRSYLFQCPLTSLSLACSVGIFRQNIAFH